jgi:hypothetical protein
VIGHAIQYDPGAGGYRDVDYPSDEGTVYPGTDDSMWHVLTITVKGAQYTLAVDGTTVSSGTVASADTGDGAFIRVWDGSQVELGTPVITQQ